MDIKGAEEADDLMQDVYTYLPECHYPPLCAERWVVAGTTFVPMTISTIGAKHPEGFAYDSIYCNAPDHLQQQIAALLKTREKAIILQSGHADKW